MAVSKIPSGTIKRKSVTITFNNDGYASLVDYFDEPAVILQITSPASDTIILFHPYSGKPIEGTNEWWVHAKNPATLAKKTGSIQVYIYYTTFD